MNTLADQQQALLHALFAGPLRETPAPKKTSNETTRTKNSKTGLVENATNNIATSACWTGERGLKSYQSNGHALAERALLSTFPVLAQLLGDESFAALARVYWHQHPPAKGDLAQWGGELPNFVKTSAQLAAEPYLGDLAALEWALHTCAGAADLAADPATFALLIDHDPNQLYLRLAPGCQVLASVWPLVSIHKAHNQNNPDHGGNQEQTLPTFAEAAQKLREKVAETAIVWRQQFQACVREALPGEAGLLQNLINGESIGQALHNATALDFNAWLPLAVQSGLLLGVEVATQGPN
jgi:Putative DNA-binding domain